jgi:hydroxyacylglutathione hydrolase
MTLLPLPAFTDNYIWMLHNGRDALVVDPGDAQPVLDALQRYSLTLRCILVTHHHADHTGGVHILRETTGAEVYGPAAEKMPEPIRKLDEGDQVSGLGINFQVMHVPGHTAGHIAYFAQLTGETPLLFCGDTLFSGGCGRLFEGTPAQMLTSLERFAALPPETRVCCTHEYTLGNLRFARVAEPGNADIANYQTHCQQLRDASRPTLPSSIGQELLINPFLRSHLDSVAREVQGHDPMGVSAEGVFATLRQWKNKFQ